MKPRFILLVCILEILASFSSCKKDFLTITTRGVLDDYTMATVQGIEGLLVGDYSMLDGVSSQFGWESASSNWVYGSIMGLEANKGTDAGDQSDLTPLQTFSETSTNTWLNTKWSEVYDAIARCNSTIRVINKALELGRIDQDKADPYIRQARVLRGWYHFEAWRMWKMIPYIDEKVEN